MIEFMKIITRHHKDHTNYRVESPYMLARSVTEDLNFHRHLKHPLQQHVSFCCSNLWLHISGAEGCTADTINR